MKKRKDKNSKGGLQKAWKYIKKKDKCEKTNGGQINMNKIRQNNKKNKAKKTDMIK